MRLLVFDVGGSHIAGAVCEADEWRLVSRGSVAIDANGSEEEFYSAVQRLASEVLQDAATSFEGMCFAFPGPFDYVEGISCLKHKFASLDGKNLRTGLAERFGRSGSQIRFVNDADAFLLGELTQSPAAREGKTVGITLGTGVGSAFAVEGEIVRAGRGVPPQGEIWNLPWKSGIVEDEISTRWIQSAYEHRTKQVKSVREMAEGSPADSAAVAVFEEFGKALGEILGTVTAEFQPSTIIFGGAISRSAELFLLHTAERLGESVRLLVSTLFEDAALYGAAAHWVAAKLPPPKP